MMKIVCKMGMGAIALLMFACGMDGVRGYKNPSQANEPALMSGSEMLVSSTEIPRRSDFVCYNFEDKIAGKHVRVHRLVAMAGDTLQIINGAVHVNGANTDKKRNLMHGYRIDTVEFEAIQSAGGIPEGAPMLPDGLAVRVSLTDATAEKFNVTAKRSVSPATEEDRYIQTTYGKPWNKDQFGPIVIPKGKLFLIGDNRDNSEDSRYLGLIDVSAIAGVVVDR